MDGLTSRKTNQIHRKGPHLEKNENYKDRATHVKEFKEDPKYVELVEKRKEAEKTLHEINEKVRKYEWKVLKPLADEHRTCGLCKKLIPEMEIESHFKECWKETVGPIEEPPRDYNDQETYDEALKIRRATDHRDKDDFWETFTMRNQNAYRENLYLKEIIKSNKLKHSASVGECFKIIDEHQKSLENYLRSDTRKIRWGRKKKKRVATPKKPLPN